MGERTGWRDKDLGERHVNVWKIPLPIASLLPTPPPISGRHRKWGDLCLAVDIDFPLLEFGLSEPVALIDYKATPLNYEPDRYTSTNRALGCIHIKVGQSYRPLPFLAVLYAKDPWIFRLIPMNDESDRIFKSKTYVVSELQYVKWLYQLRKIPFPVQIAKQLDTYIPPKKEVSESEPLSGLIGDIKTVALFDEELA